VQAVNKLFSHSMSCFYANFVGIFVVLEISPFTLFQMQFIILTEGKDPCILTNELQRDVKVLEWRPNGGKMLAVACKQVPYLSHSAY
jgi:hypothetical protein